jgi:DNA-binding transcriptional ArsR family regulator
MRDERVDRLFHALSDPTRRDILAQAMAGEHSVSALARRYPMSFAAVQKHVAVLEAAEHLTKERRGREQLVRGNVETLRVVQLVLDQLETVWRGRIDRMSEILEESKPPGGRT